MFSDLSPITIVKIYISIFVFGIVIIWAIYKLISWLRDRDEGSVESRASEAAGNSQTLEKQTETVAIHVDANEELPTIRSALHYANYDQDTFANDTIRDNNNIEQQNNDHQIDHSNQRSRYLQPKGRGSNDRILGESLTKSTNSSKSLTLRDIRSYGSRKSTGFESSISIKPDQRVQAVKGEKRESFLEILNRLNAIDEEEEDETEKRERERRRRRREEKARTQSLTGIEVNSSDETASQTFIGKSFQARPDPGRIKLSLIKAEDLTNE